MTLVDSNVLLDIFIQTPGWWEWSLARLEDAAREGPLLINDVIFAETSTRFPVIEDFEAALSQAGITVAPTPRMALFLAGKTSVQYRSAGGARSGVLPDFFIGAHAAVEQLPLLTRDTRRYRTYFPTVTLIAPNSETGA
ncbi:type II toxin-antitoxin system VapC family toxin [Bradyrhizobium australiense]|uniref:Type II toxin-antitoxin system VapC family toxin n=1 Tax=Bradyrhizobium australiense TaxID=2721161 RepID=A0A7Y4GPN8_9BRAD|nr:PIN domain-containing protein [Bradyrhizobium australiense]NOJ39454.1 type II toxin-antitoxin system VapC family toxin [Bradyrhizobium australiense]